MTDHYGGSYSGILKVGVTAQHSHPRFPMERTRKFLSDSRHPNIPKVETSKRGQTQCSLRMPIITLC